MAIEMKYDGVMKWYNFSVPATLGDEAFTTRVAYITEKNKFNTTQEISIKLVQQILLYYEEYSHQQEREAERLGI